MSVLDQMKELEAQQKALEDKKAALLKEAKEEALNKVKAALAELNALGFNYNISEGSTTTRRTGVRESVRQVIANAPEGITPAGIARALGLEDKRGKQSISNALSALKKASTVAATDGVYKAT